MAQSMRAAALTALLATILSTAAAGQAPIVDPYPTYIAAVAAYAKTGDISRAVLPLQQWSAKDFETAIRATVASKNTLDLRSAAVFHLEIGVALAGVSVGAAAGHIEYGSDLLDRWTARRFPGPIAGEEERRFRATWLGVAGSAFLSVKDVSRARPLLDKTHKILPRSARAQTLLGTLQEFQGYLNNPDAAPTLNRRARYKQEQSVSFYQAERAYREALQYDDGYALAHIRLGRVLFLSGKVQEARASLERGRQLAKDPHAQYLSALFLGALLQHEKDVEGARRLLEQALAIAPTSQPAAVALAYLELMAGRPDRANAVVRSLAEAPTTSEPWWAFHHGGLDLAGLRSLREQVVLQ